MDIRAYISSKLPYRSSHFQVVTFLFSATYFFLISQQVAGIAFVSDVPAHIGLAMHPDATNAGGYSMLHWVLQQLAALMTSSKTDIKALFSIGMVLATTTAVFVTMQGVRRYLISRNPDASPYMIDYLTLALMLVSMIILDTGATELYIGDGTPNPWHNPTYIFSRPFAMWSFLLVLQATEAHQRKHAYVRYLIPLSAIATLSMWAKPSFLLSFLPAVACILLYQTIRKKVSVSFLCWTGVALLPPLVPLYLINQMVFAASEASNSIIIVNGTVWKLMSNNIPASILLGMAFPLFVFVINIKHTSQAFTLAFVNYFLSTLIFYFIAESGDRMSHANFSWGYLFGMFFMFLVATEELFLSKNLRPWARYAGFILFILHLVSGIFYFHKLISGLDYY